jgi:hypothetical protein
LAAYPAFCIRRQSALPVDVDGWDERPGVQDEGLVREAFRK